MTSFKFQGYQLTFMVSENGNKVQVWCEDGPFARLSAIIHPLPAGQFFLKHWSENEELATFLMEQGIIEEVTPRVCAKSGFVTAHACRFTELGLQYIKA